jgi:hypothetical protein
MMHCTSHAGFPVGLFILNGVDLYLSGMFMYRRLVTALKLEDLFAASRDRLTLMRLVIVIRFGVYAIIWMATVSIVAASAWLMGSWPFRTRVLEELCILALFGIDIWVFLYRNKFCIALEPEEVATPQDDRLKDETVIWLAGPANAQYACMG